MIGNMFNAEEARDKTKNWKTYKVFDFIKEKAEKGENELVITTYFFDENPDLIEFMIHNLGYEISFDKEKVVYRIKW